MSDGANGRRPDGIEQDQWVHRQALQIIGLLPDDFQRALAILERAKFLMECWTMEPVAREATVRLLRAVPSKDD